MRDRRALGSKVLVAAIFTFVGFIVTLQLRGTDQDEFGHLRQGELVELLKSVDNANDRVDKQIEELRRTRNDLLSSASKSKVGEERAKKRAHDLAVLAGTVPAVGPGISVRISDRKGSVGAALLLDAVAELRDAGAEAIEINDEIRVVAHTYFQDAEAGPVADGVELTPPFVIKVIGPPHTLRAALEFPQGLVDKLKDRDATISIATHKRIRITAVASERVSQYSQPRSDAD